MQQLIQALAGAHRVLVFTGAGLSTGSGIPDFRGPQGVWKKRLPVYFDEFVASEAKRLEYWEWSLAGRPVLERAQPNAAHLAIAELERLGRVEAVVTQNIDGLHQAAGSSADKIVELHGTSRLVECTRCGLRSDPSPAFAYFAAHRQVPRCPCGGWLKTATVSFGQELRREDLDRAFRAAARCDLVLALGSTLSVYPASEIPLAAAERGVPYVIVNRGDTDHDDRCTLRIDGDVVEVLPPAIAALRAHPG